MRPPLVLLGMFALAGCKTTGAVGEVTPKWLVGTWCPRAPGTMHAGVYVMQQPTTFGVDGTYSTFEDTGRWQLEGDRLRRVTGAQVHYVDRIERLGRDRMAWTKGFGSRELWRRCTERP